MNATLDKKTMIKWFISMVVALVPFLFPLSEIYSAQMRLFLVITIFGIAIMAFELMNNAAIALLMCVAWSISGVATFADAFSAYNTSNIWLVISAMLVVTAVEGTGLLNRLGYWAIIKAKASFSGMMWGYFFAGILIAQVSFNMAIVLTFALGYAIYSSLNLKPTDRESLVIVLVAILGGLSSSVYTYCPVTVSLINYSVSALIPGFNLTWYEIIFYNIPMLLVGMVTLVAGLAWYKRGPKSTAFSAEDSAAMFKAKYEELGKMSIQEKKAAFLLIFVTVFLVTQIWHGLDLSYGFLIPAIVAYLPGVNIADTNSIKKVPWETIFVVATFLALGTIATKLGMNAIIVATVVPIISQMGEYWSVFGTFVFGTLSNFILSPFAMLAVLPAPITSYTLASGFDPIPHLMALYNAKDLIFLPYEYPSYLILFSFGMVKMNGMIKVCFFKAIFLIAGILLVMMPFWHFLGLM